MGQWARTLTKLLVIDKGKRRFIVRGSSISRTKVPTHVRSHPHRR